MQEEADKKEKERLERLKREEEERLERKKVKLLLSLNCVRQLKYIGSLGNLIVRNISTLLQDILLLTME